jgi:Sulfotransferase family
MRGLRDRTRLGSAVDRLRTRMRTQASVGAPSGEPYPGDGVPVFFVVGLAKSGTTWLMKTLDAHPEVLCKGEGRFFGEEYRREVLARTQTKQQPSSLYNALLGSEYLRLWIERSVWTREGETDEQITDLVRLATDYFLTTELSKSGKKVVGDKTPLLGPKFVEEIHEIYPEAKVIHIIRDGRDQAVSFIHQQGNRAKRGRTHRLSPEELAKSEAYRRSPQELAKTGEGMFAEKTLRKAAQNWDLRVGQAIEDGPALFGDAYTEVRYEDLLERPNEEVERLLGFLGVDTDRTLVERCVSSASFEKLSKGRERGQEDPTSFYRKGIAGDWKDLFNERDRQVYKEEAGQLLIRLGYEKDGGW